MHYYFDFHLSVLTSATEKGTMLEMRSAPFSQHDATQRWMIVTLLLLSSSVPKGIVLLDDIVLESLCLILF